MLRRLWLCILDALYHAACAKVQLLFSKECSEAAFLHDGSTCITTLLHRRGATAGALACSHTAMLSSMRQRGAVVLVRVEAVPP